VTVDELLGLAASLSVAVVDLLNPAMLAFDPPRIDLGVPTGAPLFDDLLLLLVGEDMLWRRGMFDWPAGQVMWAGKNEPRGYMTARFSVEPGEASSALPNQEMTLEPEEE
jgi:hypothetical protein